MGTGFMMVVVIGGVVVLTGCVGNSSLSARYTNESTPWSLLIKNMV